MDQVIVLTLSEQIDRARDGKSQIWVIKKMRDRGIKISEPQFTSKKKGTSKFTDDEFSALEDILNVTFII